jgi:hypothetical protein
MRGYGLDEDIEVELNRQVDHAEQRVRMNPEDGGENPYLNETPEDLVTRIERCSNEIKSILPLIAMSKTMGVPANDIQTTQDERVLNAAKDLLKKEVDTLCDLVEAIFSGR